MTYFLYRYNQEESLNARTLLGCLIRQYLNVKTLLKPIKTQLEALFKDTLFNANDLYPLFKIIVTLSFPYIYFIIINNIDRYLLTDSNLILDIL